jgi:hypothetical protein
MAVQTGQYRRLPAPSPVPFWLQRVSLLRWFAFTMAVHTFAYAAPRCLLDGIPGARLPGSAVYPRCRPLRTSRGSGGYAVTPAPGGRGLHPHGELSCKAQGFAVCPEDLRPLSTNGSHLDESGVDLPALGGEHLLDTRRRAEDYPLAHPGSVRPGGETRIVLFTLCEYLLSGLAQLSASCRSTTLPGRGRSPERGLVLLSLAVRMDEPSMSDQWLRVNNHRLALFSSLARLRLVCPGCEQHAHAASAS